MAQMRLREAFLGHCAPLKTGLEVVKRFIRRTYYLGGANPALEQPQRA